jgi:hypothetical protein
MSTLSPPVLSAMSAADNNDSVFADFDAEALERKNASRKKFGLKPMTPEEFMDNETQIQQLEVQQEQRKVDLQQERAAQATAKMAEQQKQQRSSLIPGFLEKMMGGSDTCESNFDCESPQVCCDFGFTRKCCSSGSRQRSYEYAYVPVPVDIQDPSHY